MKRITVRRKNGVTLAPGWDFCIDPEDYDLVQKLLTRLAEYEDTGLEPSEIRRKRRMSPMDDAELRAKANHVKDLLVAESEGRLIVLPCKPDDTVFDTLFGRVTEETVVSVTFLLSQSVNHMAMHVANARGAVTEVERDRFGKSVFRTRKEAEDALKRVKEDMRNIWRD